MRQLSVAITVDVDNDGLALDNERNRLSWQGLELVPQIAEIIHSHRLPATWFVRADPQLRSYYGSVGFLLEKHRSMWRSLVAEGDEIGWHPHLYAVRHDGTYEPEHDDERLTLALHDAHAELNALGHKFASVRMGEAIGSDAILRTLAKLGLLVDSSCIPGRLRADSARRFDWSSSPNGPYWPSMADYRVPGAPASPILEVPMTTAPVRAPYDPKPLLRYASLAYRPAIFEKALERWFQDDGTLGDGVLTLILHPDELMPRLREHPLYALTPDALRVNIQTLLNLAHRRGTDVVGKTMVQIRQSFCQTGNDASRHRHPHA